MSVNSYIYDDSTWHMYVYHCGSMWLFIWWQTQQAYSTVWWRRRRLDIAIGGAEKAGGVASTPALVAIAVAASHACTHHQSWSWPACTSIGRSLAATRTSGRNKEAATHFPCEETKQTPINVQLTPSKLTTCIVVAAGKKRVDRSYCCCGIDACVQLHLQLNQLMKWKPHQLL